MPPASRHAQRMTTFDSFKVPAGMNILQLKGESLRDGVARSLGRGHCGHHAQASGHKNEYRLFPEKNVSSCCIPSLFSCTWASGFACYRVSSCELARPCVGVCEIYVESAFRKSTDASMIPFPLKRC